MSLDMDSARELFEGSTDFTVGLEEEFGILDPATLALTDRFEELFEACGRDDLLAESAAGELIASEIEIRSGRGRDLGDAAARQREHRARLFSLCERLGIALGAMGTHPSSSYLDQRIIDTPHYRRVEDGLRYVAWRNNTFSLHVHVGIRGADRAIAVCDRLREKLPILLALSANSPFLDGRDSGLASVRSQTFTKSFPRCGVPEPFEDWRTYADFVGLLERTDSIIESTQLWWSVRPHHRFGTVEVRICDAQTSGPESLALASLITACTAQAALDEDEGAGGPLLKGREIEENMWRAIRFGMDGRFVDFAAGREVEAAQAHEQLLAWCEPARSSLGIDVDLPGANGAQRAREALASGSSIDDYWRAAVAETRSTYAAEEVPG